MPKTEEELQQEEEEAAKEENLAKGSMLDNMSKEEKEAMRRQFGAAFEEMERNGWKKKIQNRPLVQLSTALYNSLQLSTTSYKSQNTKIVKQSYDNRPLFIL